MSTLPEAILEYATSSPEGHIMSPKEFLHIGTRAAVDQALSRLSRDGYLIRVDRGAYVAAVQGQAGIRPPSAEKVIESLAALSGELIVPDGATSAIAFGLEEQGGAARVYLTSGRSRTLLIGDVEVVLCHAPAWMLVLGDRPAGAAVRTISWIGPDAADMALAKIQNALSNLEWQMLVACRAALPSWMARAIGEFVTRETERQPQMRTLKVTSSQSGSSNLNMGANGESPSNQTIGFAKACAG